MGQAAEQLRARATELARLADAIDAAEASGPTVFYITRASNYSDQPCPEAVESGGSLWEIEIDGLAALIALARREGELIVSAPTDAPWRGEERPHIRIFDDHLEPLDP